MRSGVTAKRTFSLQSTRWAGPRSRRQVESEWVLSLSDYEMSDRLLEELSNLHETVGVAGYRASFIYRIHGRRCRDRYIRHESFFIVSRTRYTSEEHGHRVTYRETCMR